MATEQQPPANEEELRAAYEAELARLDATDMIAQALVSLMNLGAVRLSPPGDQQPDVEQARDAIDGARALLPLLERRRPQEAAQLRGPLSQLQMAYVRAAPQAGEEGTGQAAPPPGAPAAEPQSPSDSEAPGPAESSGRLWVPGR